MEKQEIIKQIIGHAKNIIDWVDNTEWHPSRAHAKDIIAWAEKL